VKKQLIEYLLSMKPGDFERLVARLLGAMGYDNITVTRHNADGGVDVLADIQMDILRLCTAVQVKRLNRRRGRRKAALSVNTFACQ
jgi:restriction system protein